MSYGVYKKKTIIYLHFGGITNYVRGSNQLYTDFHSVDHAKLSPALNGATCRSP